MHDPSIVCPAGAPIHPAASGSTSVLCGVLSNANAGAHVGGYQRRGHVSPIMSGEHDPTIVATYCAGPGVTGSLCSYAMCPVWRAGRDADWADRKGPDALRDEQAHRPPAGVRDALPAGV